MRFLQSPARLHAHCLSHAHHHPLPEGREERRGRRQAGMPCQVKDIKEEKEKVRKHGWSMGARQWEERVEKCWRGKKVLLKL